MMKPSRTGLCAILTILLLCLAQALATQSHELSTTKTKDWRSYFWARPATTSSAISVPSSAQKTNTLLTSQSSAITSPAPSQGSHVHNARWLAAGPFDVLADLFRCAIVLVIMTPLVHFYDMLVIIYRDGDGFQPGEALEYVIDALRVEEIYKVVALAPYLYLVRKVAGTINAVKAWTSHRKVNKTDNKRTAVVPLENLSSLHAGQQFLLRLELLMKDRAQEEDEDADAEESDLQEKYTEDGNWLLVNEDEQEQNVV